ncbi:YybH family protein [Polystyrenella longa]|uniref:YybH family protein n=1 Tax=Polystyrenella longa TaxID=2528007 RepID=UPI0018D20C97|nr:nuclear transport factor 2 family protein [Polystyrenella longa]
MNKKLLTNIPAFISVFCIAGLLCADEPPTAPPATEVKEAPAAVSTKTETAVEPTADLKKALDGYVSAYNERNVDALLSYWSAGGVYTTSNGNQIQGIEELKESFTSYFADLDKSTRLEVPEYEHEMISPKIARETGIAMLYQEGQDPERSEYTAYYIREGDEWKLESLEELVIVPEVSNYEQLQPLEWMIGEWVIDGNKSDTTVTFTNKWTMNQNFIISNFTITTDGQTEMSGAQLIGWDPVAETLRSWIFDSQGGFGTGSWSENNGHWSLRMLFQTNEGETASAINIYTPIDMDTYQFESVSRERGGQLLPSIEKVTAHRVVD